ncbi:DUF998 domain-containing protein [[Eubacterium] cellulosolvens]
MTTSKGREHASLVKWLALCGIIAVILYNVVASIAGSLSPFHDFIQNTGVSLGFEGSPVAWFYNPLGPMSYGVLIILFSIGLWIGRVGRIGSFFLAISGIGEIIIGLYPVTYATFQPFLTGIYTILVGVIVMLFAFAESMRRKDTWKHLWKYTFVSAIGFTILSIVTIFEVYSFASGLREAILTWILWLWILIVAYRLYRLHT